MSVLYLDASAVVKRYSPEPGSNWVEAQVSSTENSLVTAEFTMAEVAAAIAAKHRAPQGISLDERDAALSDSPKACAIVRIGIGSLLLIGLLLNAPYHVLRITVCVDTMPSTSQLP